MPWSFFFRPVRILTVLRRVLALLALAFACGLSLVSEAAVPAGQIDPSSTGWQNVSGTGTSACRGNNFCSAGQACQDTLAGSAYEGWSVSRIVQTGPSSATCYAVSGSGAEYWRGELSASSPYVPPPSCSDPSLSNKYRGAGYTTASTQSSPPDYICIKGCQYDPGSVTVTYPNPKSVTGYTSGGRAGPSSGQSCDMTNWPQITIDVDMSNATDPSKLPPSPEVCSAQGKFFGQVNGVDVCSPAVPGGTTTSTTNTNTSTTDSPASSPAASSNSNSSTTTTCSETTCTTTTTVNVSVGGGGGGGGASSPGASTCQSGQGASAVAGTCTTTSTTSRQQFCQQNPQAVQCKDDSVSGGADCSAPPVCSGDAISCAILQQQWNTRCELQKHDDSTDLGSKLANGQDPMAGQLPTPGKADQVDLSSKLSNVDDMGIAAQCLGNIDVPLQLPGGGWNLHIDTTPLCDMGKLLGYLNMLSTLMLCAYMLKGSF